MPKKAPEEPKPLSFATPDPWSPLPRGVHVGTGHGDAFPWGAGHGTLRDTRK